MDSNDSKAIYELAENALAPSRRARVRPWIPREELRPQVDAARLGFFTSSAARGSSGMRHALAKSLVVARYAKLRILDG